MSSSVLVLIVLLLVSTITTAVVYNRLCKEREINAKLREAEIITSLHWNPAIRLTPVGIPIYILVAGEQIEVVRKNWLEDRGQEPVYNRIDNNEVIEGKYNWRYA